MSTFRISLHQAIYSLSDALDLVGVTHIHHGKRVAYIAAECAKQGGWSPDRLNALSAAILTTAVFPRHRYMPGWRSSNGKMKLNTAARR
jgi:hypothetical protein